MKELKEVMDLFALLESIVADNQRLTERMDDVEHGVRTLDIQVDCLEAGEI
jgi:hypothetical protein